MDNNLVFQAVMTLMGFILTVTGTILVMYFKEMKSNVKETMKAAVDISNDLRDTIKDQAWHREEAIQVKEISLNNRKDIARNKERLHSLEGGQKTLLKYFNLTTEGD